MSSATSIKARITLPNLADPRLYVPLLGVAILDVHCRNAVDQNGNSIETYCGPDQLAVLAKNSQARVDRGELGLVRVGHIDVKLPNHRERDQPGIIGYIPRYYMGEKDDQVVILADIYIKRKHIEDVENYPRRSPEIFGKTDPDGFIDALALLNRPPERDLGLVTYAKSIESPGERTMIDENDCNMIVQAVVAAMGQFFESQAGGETNPVNPEGEPMAAEVAPEGMPPEAMDAGAGGAMGASLGGAGGTFPAATSTSVPSPAEEKPKEHEHMQSSKFVQELLNMRGDFELFKKNTLETFSKDANRIKTLESDLETKNLELRRERRSATLTNLEREGFRLNHKKELEVCMKLNDSDFMDNVTRIRENYSRDITNHPFVPIDMTVAVDEDKGIPKTHLTPIEKRLGIKVLETYSKTHPEIKRDDIQARYLDDIEYREKVISNARKTA